MQIGIIELTTVLPGLEDGPSTGQQIADWLAPALPEARMQVFPVAGGAALPDPSACDGYVISGSGAGVYDTPDWMAPLRAFLLLARDAGKPLVGICFGHQIMADTFGGRAEKASIGKVVGVRGFDLEGTRHPAYVWHQDQVTIVPPGARVVGSADHCPVGALAYDFPAWSVQFHPEYTQTNILAEIGAATPEFVSETVAREALAEIAVARVAPDLTAAKAAETLRRSASISGS